MIRRRQNVLGGNGRLAHIPGEAVGAADDLAPRKTAPGEDSGISPRPVMPAGAFGFGVDARRAAVLTHPQHRRLLQQVPKEAAAAGAVACLSLRLIAAGAHLARALSNDEGLAGVVAQQAAFVTWPPSWPASMFDARTRAVVR